MIIFVIQLGFTNRLSTHRACVRLMLLPSHLPSRTNMACRWVLGHDYSRCLLVREMLDGEEEAQIRHADGLDFGDVTSPDIFPCYVPHVILENSGGEGEEEEEEEKLFIV